MNVNKKDFLARFGSEDHINSLIKDPNYENQMFLLENPNIETHHIEKLANTTKDRYIIRHIVRNEKTPDSVIDKFIKFPNWHSSMASKKNLSPEHIDHLMNEKNDDAKDTLARKSENLQERHYEKLAQHSSWDVRYSLAKNPKITDHWLRHLTNDENVYVAQEAKEVLNSRLQKQEK